MKMTKKAEGLALNTIVIAAIALIVLLIVIGVIYGTGNKVLPFFNKQSDCVGSDKVCQKEADSCDGAKIYGLKCPSESPVCCVKKT